MDAGSDDGYLNVNKEQFGDGFLMRSMIENADASESFPDTEKNKVNMNKVNFSTEIATVNEQPESEKFSPRLVSSSEYID